jgi:hypothetical protein
MMEDGNEMTLGGCGDSVTSHDSAVVTGGQESRDDSPESQVHQLNRTIKALKLLLAAVLLIATAVSAGLVHTSISNSEEHLFHSDFELIGDSIAAALVDDTSYFFQVGQSTAVALTLIMKANNATQSSFSIPVPEYRSLTDAVTKETYYASWNPLLRNDDERRQFEKMVAVKESEGYFSAEINPPCYVCGDEELAPSTPELIVSLSGIGEYA